MTEQRLTDLIETARLLGATQAKKGFGCYTEQDCRFEHAMYESIAAHRAAILSADRGEPVAYLYRDRDLLGFKGRHDYEKSVSVTEHAWPALATPQPDTVQVPPTGVGLIAQERERQIQQEGWNANHDREHKPGELATAGYHYAANAAACLGILPGSLHVWDNWPWHPSWWKPTTPMRDLVKAGALIAAELDRMIAATPKESKE